MLTFYQLPDKTNWQDVKDFVKSQIPRKLDIYVNISGKRKDSGWIRVIGLKAFKEVRSKLTQTRLLCSQSNITHSEPGVLQESPFRGHEILAHNPGYEEDGTGMVLVRAPFFKDKYLFVDPSTMPSPVASAVPSPVATSPLNAQPPMSPEAYYLPQGYYAEQEPAMPIHSQQFWWAMQPPTPPNTPKTRQQQQQQYQSGWWMPQDAPPSPQQTVPVKSRKLIITWKDRTRLESDPATDQEKMGTIIQAALSATSERSLDTLECFPGVAVATFRTYSLTRRAMRDLEELESLTVTPVVEETAAPSETNMEKSATPPARKRNSQTAVQQTAPVVVVGSRPLVSDCSSPHDSHIEKWPEIV